MNTAVKLNHPDSQQCDRVIHSESKKYKAAGSRSPYGTVAPEQGRNERRIHLILEQGADQADVFALFGWSDLPSGLKEIIRRDMEAYRDELLGLYSSCDQGVKNRRKRVSYWVRAYRDGACSEETAIEVLSNGEISPAV